MNKSMNEPGHQENWEHENMVLSTQGVDSKCRLSGLLTSYHKFTFSCLHFQWFYSILGLKTQKFILIHPSVHNYSQYFFSRFSHNIPMEVNISILLSPNCDDLGINPLYHLSVSHLSDTRLGVSASNRLFPNPSLFLFLFFFCQFCCACPTCYRLYLDNLVLLVSAVWELRPLSSFLLN